MYATTGFEPSVGRLKTVLCLQAYDGHMNLILSDVEETIMIVDLDGTTGPQGTVNVRLLDIAFRP